MVYRFSDEIWYKHDNMHMKAISDSQTKDNYQLQSSNAIKISDNWRKLLFIKKKFNKSDNQTNIDNIE